VIEIRVTEVYRKWIQRLRDSRAKARIRQRIRRLRQGNPGDWKSLGENVIEMRIDYGPGYRVHYKDTGKAIIILLCGGDKTTQEADIVKAKRLAKEEEEGEDENK
jgi:putative addiction module killer protein